MNSLRGDSPPVLSASDPSYPVFDNTNILFTSRTVLSPADEQDKGRWRCLRRGLEETWGLQLGHLQWKLRGNCRSKTNPNLLSSMDSDFPSTFLSKWEVWTKLSPQYGGPRQGIGPRSRVTWGHYGKGRERGSGFPSLRHQTTNRDPGSMGTTRTIGVGMTTFIVEIISEG